MKGVYYELSFGVNHSLVAMQEIFLNDFESFAYMGHKERESIQILIERCD